LLGTPPSPNPKHNFLVIVILASSTMPLKRTRFRGFNVDKTETYFNAYFDLYSTPRFFFFSCHATYIPHIKQPCLSTPECSPTNQQPESQSGLRPQESAIAIDPGPATCAVATTCLREQRDVESLFDRQGYRPVQLHTQGWG
jgi:hypothetical protein